MCIETIADDRRECRGNDRAAAPLPAAAAVPSILSDLDRRNDHRLNRLITLTGRRRLDRLDDVHTLDDLAEDWVRRGRALVEVVEEIVVDGVDEDLRAARVGHARVRHRDCAGLVGDLADELIRDIAALTRDDGAVGRGEGGAGRRAASAGTGRGRILAVRAAKLAHEIVDDAVKREPIVEARLGEVRKVAAGDGQLIHEQLSLEVAL